MRLIDADALEKELEKMTLDFLDDKTIQGNFCAGVTVETLEEVRKAPTVDTVPTESEFKRIAIQRGYVPVVRCEECVFSIKDDNREPMYKCVNIYRYGCTQWVGSDDFCSYGERITDDRT